MNLKFHNTMCF